MVFTEPHMDPEFALKFGEPENKYCFCGLPKTRQLDNEKEATENEATWGLSFLQQSWNGQGMFKRILFFENPSASVHNSWKESNMPILDLFPTFS